MVSERGYAFVTQENGGPDVFLHMSQVSKAGLNGIEKGDRISFDLAPGRNGRTQAENIKLLDEAA
jgi:cold shock protein